MPEPVHRDPNKTSMVSVRLQATLGACALVLIAILGIGAWRLFWSGGSSPRNVTVTEATALCQDKSTGLVTGSVAVTGVYKASPEGRGVPGGLFASVSTARGWDGRVLEVGQSWPPLGGFLNVEPASSGHGPPVQMPAIPEYARVRVTGSLECMRVLPGMGTERGELPYLPFSSFGVVQ